ncbi:MAG: small basic protein [Planctomycetota bacterium]|nr:small basic protein [Planctomycetota bacterium]
MSIHPSLRTKPSGLNQFRTVLKRDERIAKLSERGDFKDGDSPLGLVKVAQRRLVAKKKKKAEEGTAEEGAVETPTES